MVRHHLDNVTLLRYASGDLDEAFSVIVASHIAMCETCRHAARDAEAIGGNLLDELDQAELSPTTFDILMQKLEQDENSIKIDPQPVSGKGHEAADVPIPLQRLIGSTLENIPWKRVAPGIRRHMIEPDRTSRSSLYMLEIAAGKAVPEHGHGGVEMTLVLSGAYRDQLGLFGPGDIADLDEDVEHQPKVEPGTPCICLVATEKPTRFKGFFSRMLQPLVGI